MSLLSRCGGQMVNYFAKQKQFRSKNIITMVLQSSIEVHPQCDSYAVIVELPFETIIVHIWDIK